MDSETIIGERSALSGLKNHERDVDWSSGNDIVDPFGVDPKVAYGRSGVAVFDTLLGDTVSSSAYDPAVSQERPALPLKAEDWGKFFEEYARDHAQEQSAEGSPQTSQLPAPTGATAGPQLHTPSSSGHSDTQSPFSLGEYFPAPSREPVSESLWIDSQLFAFNHEVGNQRLATPPTSANSEIWPPNPPDEDFLADWHGPVWGYPFMDSPFPVPFPVLDHAVDARAQLASGITQPWVQSADPEGEAQGVLGAGGFPVGDLQLPTWLSGQMPQQRANFFQGYGHMNQLCNVPQKGNTRCYAPQGSFPQNGVAASPQGWQFPGYPPAQGLCLQNGTAVAPQEPQLPGDSVAQGHPVPLDPNSRDSIMRRVYVDPKDGDTLYVLDAPARPVPGQAGVVVRDLLAMEDLRLTKYHQHALPIIVERWLQSRRNQKKLAKARRQNGGKWQVRVAGLSA
ncbi:hypothetical protein DL764_009829 [Monosporascus ibericus]|uniref:Uncharacterized protein n=1 Tax=Monosporascus ibericus TaxID=155417 RepID=A0A4Q4SW17_9PEZI|nr:hypothetical protein DL764_009829 [Monosporascus ibericus]